MSDVVIAKLSALLGFQFDDKNLLKFKIGMVGAIGAVAKFSADVVRATVDLDNFNKRTGISVEAIRDWQILAEQSNVSAESINSAFQSISNMKGKLLAGKGLDSAWGLLGINGSEDPEMIFEKVLNQLGKIEDVNLRNARLTEIGFDSQLVNLIGKTREDVDGIFKDLQLTEKERKSLLEVKKSFTDLRLLLSNLKEKFVALFYPIKLFLDLATRLYSIFYKIIDSTIGWGNAIKILATVFTGLMVVFAPLTSLITAIGLAIEDVWTYFEGGESYFGMFVKNAGVLGQVIAGLIKGFALFIKTGLQGFPIIFKIISGVLSGLIQGFALFIKTGLQGFPIVFKIIGGVLSGFIQLLQALYDTLMLVLEPLAKVGRFVGKGIGKGLGAIKGIFKSEEEIKPTINSGSITPINNSNNTSNKNVVNNINVNNNIDGARNPEAMAIDIFNSFSQQLNETETEL